MRVEDEFVVDFMKSAGGIEYNEAKHFVKAIPVHGVNIPFVSPELPLRFKQTLREKDKLDLLFLQELVKK